MSDVILIRPGCTDFDDQHRIQGNLDLPLNAAGEQQLADNIEQLEKLPIEIVLAGTCQPVRSVAESIAQALGTKLKISESWNNVDLGLWQGLAIGDVRRKYPKAFKQWVELPESICPPKGETFREATTRLRKALDKALRKRSCFAIVASEPLATVISCLLKGECLSLPDSLTGGEPVRVVEVLHCNRLPEQPESVSSGTSASQSD